MREREEIKGCIAFKYGHGAMKITVRDEEIDKNGALCSYEADLDDAYLLLERMNDSKAHLNFKSDHFLVDYHLLTDTYEVEIYDMRDGFWAISEVGIIAARKIMEMVSENTKFGHTIPTTNEELGGLWRRGLCLEPYAHQDSVAKNRTMQYLSLVAQYGTSSNSLPDRMAVN